MSNPSKHYQGLPRVDSPSHLDEQILAEAVRLAPTPAKSSKWLGATGWVSLAATASVIGLTVFVIRPGVDLISSGGHSLEPNMVQMEETVSLAGQNSGVSDEQVQDLTLAPRLQAEFQEMPEAPVLNEPGESTTMSSASAFTEPVQSLPMARSSAPTKPETNVASEKALLAESAPLNTEQQSDLAKPLARAKSTASMVADIAVAKEETTDVVSKQALSDQLAHIQTLVDEGRETDAIQALQNLIKRCPGCDIPPSIQALLD